MKVYNPTTVGSDFTAELQFRLNSPASGFSFCFGSGTGASDFVTGLAFSGYSGYLFDQSGNFFGGYRSGQRFDLQVHGFSESRASYFYNGVLIANNIALNCGVNCVEFNKIGNSSVIVRMAAEDLVEEEEEVEGGIMYNGAYILFNGEVILFS